MSDSEIATSQHHERCDQWTRLKVCQVLHDAPALINNDAYRDTAEDCIIDIMGNYDDAYGVKSRLRPS